MTKAFNKFVKVLMITLMVLAIAMPIQAQGTGAQAAPSDSPKLTINNLKEGDNVTIYKVIDLKYQADEKTFSHYEWANGLEQKFGEDEKKYAEGTKVSQKFLDLTGSTATNPNANDDGILKEFINKLAKTVIEPESNVYKITKTADQSGSVVFTKAELDLKLGAYIAIVTNDEDTTSYYRPMFVPTQLSNNPDPYVTSYNYSAKCGTVSLTKTIDEENKTVKVGEVVNYTIEITVPNYLDSSFNQKIELKDILGKGLTYIPDSLTIKTTPRPDGTTENLEAYFTATNTPETDRTGNKTGNTQIDIKLTGKYFDVTEASGVTTKGLNSLLNSDRKIVIKYQATVNEFADMTYTTNPNSLTTTLDNKVDYLFNSQQHIDSSETLTSSVNSLTYELDITKKLFDENGKPMADTNCAGTTFYLYEGAFDNNTKSVAGTELKFVLNNGIYTLSNDPNASPNLVADANGKIKINGLDVDTTTKSATFTLKEVVQPNVAGVALPQDPYNTITITDTERDGKIDKVEVVRPKGVSSAKVDESQSNQLNVTVNNYKGEFNIPNTGSTGTMIFTVGGMLLMTGAVAIIVIASKNRKSRQ